MVTAPSSSAAPPGAQCHQSTISSEVFWQGCSVLPGKAQNTPSYTHCEGGTGATLPCESPERIFYIKKGKTGALKCLVQLHQPLKESLAPAVEL